MSALTKPILGLYGAFDRFNFGDLLFPKVVYQFAPPSIQDRFECVHLGMRAADLTDRGGQVVRPIQNFLNGHTAPPGSVVVLVGGEILTASADALWRCLYPSDLPELKNLWLRVLRKIETGDTLKRAMRRLQLPWALPFVPRTHQIPGAPRIAFLGAGGQRFDGLHQAGKQWVVAALNEAIFSSVRDSVTHTSVAASGATSTQLAPDSVHAISRLSNIDDLLAGASAATRKIVKDCSPTGYFCVQAAQRHLGKNAGEVAAALDTLATRTGLMPVLVAAGTAPGHDDHLGLQCVSHRMKTPHVFVPFPSMMDVVALLACSKLVLSTSLHAMIVAISYSVPHHNFSGLESKTANYLKAWAPESYVEGATFTTLVPDAEKALARSQASLRQLADRLSTLASENIGRMWQAVEAAGVR